MKKLFGRRAIAITITLVIFALLLLGCRASNLSTQTGTSQNNVGIIIPENNGIVAVYLAPKNSQVISESDLNAHPEILKITDFATLTTYINRYIIPIWIDKDALDILPQGWLNQSPQKFYPIIVLGCGDPLYALRDKLGLPVYGPYVDWSNQTIESGFSVWMLKIEPQGNITSVMQGYEGGINISNILKASNTLFNECFKALEYRNTQYNFNFYLPLTWNNYKVLESKWTGYKVGPKGEEVAETGTMVTIRNPQWTDKEPTQDIPIMVFTIAQWNSLEQNEFFVSAAPIGPTELGRNSKYVFGLPPRYNFAFPKGFEVVDEIMQSKPLSAF